VGAAHDRERGVEDRHTEDEQRDEQRCEEEVRLTAERLAARPPTTIVDAAMSRPSNRAPQSPMKMRAGWKLWGKNPTHIPSTITDTIGEIEPSASSPASFSRCA
jgi:hypothetical protein